MLIRIPVSRYSINISTKNIVDAPPEINANKSSLYLLPNLVLYHIIVDTRDNANNGIANMPSTLNVFSVKFLAYVI